MFTLFALFFVLSCSGQETPIEEAEEEADVEEVEETTRDIATEGCPEGQTANAAGTECIDLEEAAASHGPDPNDPETWRSGIDFERCEQTL